MIVFFLYHCKLKLYHAGVDRVTIYNNDKLSLKTEKCKIFVIMRSNCKNNTEFFLSPFWRWLSSLKGVIEIICIIDLYHQHLNCSEILMQLELLFHWEIKNIRLDFMHFHLFTFIIKQKYFLCFLCLLNNDNLFLYLIIVCILKQKKMNAIVTPVRMVLLVITRSTNTLAHAHLDGREYTAIYVSLQKW